MLSYWRLHYHNILMQVHRQEHQTWEVCITILSPILPLFNSSNFWSECQCICIILSFRVENDRCSTHKDKDAGLGSSFHFFCSITSIYKWVFSHSSPQRLRYIKWHIFFGVSVKIFPIKVIEPALWHAWKIRIKINSSSWWCFKTPKHMMHLLQMPNPRTYQMLLQQS